MKDPKSKEILLRTAKNLASDNADLVVNYVQKRAAERAVTIITTRLRDGKLRNRDHRTVAQLCNLFLSNCVSLSVSLPLGLGG